MPRRHCLQTQTRAVPRAWQQHSALAAKVFELSSTDEAALCKVLRTLVRMEPETAAAVPSYSAEALRLGTLLRQAGLPLDDRLLRMLIISALHEMESVQTHLLYAKDSSGNPLDLAATQKILATMLNIWADLCCKRLLGEH